MNTPYTWTRARSGEQKEQRINEIVLATESLYKKFGYEEITFVQIAKEAGFTRSNLYKYFKSKEEIFLEFLKYDIKLWKNDLLNDFYKDGYYSIDEFSEIWADLLKKNRRLIELISILYEHLEKHASFESLLNFKESFSEVFQLMAEHLVNKIEGLSFEKVIEFFSLQSALGIGLFQMADLSDNQLKVLEKPKYSHYKIDFHEKFTKGVKYILAGLLGTKN
ncbi:TetR family transcriptional regulator [Candidatus Neomarinimicrobiota bacterium]